MSFRKDFMYPFKDLVALMRRMDSTLYMIASETEMSDPKCPYCDNNRMITLTAPNGQSQTVPCICGANKHKVYYVVPCRAISMTLDEMSVEFRYEYGQRKYVRRHDSMIDPGSNDKRLKSTNYISMSFTSVEKAKAFIDSQGWPYSQELTDEATEKAEKGFGWEVKEKLRPLKTDEKLKAKYAQNGMIFSGTYHDTDPDPATVCPTEPDAQSEQPAVQSQSAQSEKAEQPEQPAEKELSKEEIPNEAEEIEPDETKEDDGSWWD